MRPIGVLGGTFDPIHVGHLRSALELLETLDLAELRFVPAKQPPHRPLPRLDGASRARLISSAIRNQPGFVLDTRELSRPGPSYTVDTLAAMRAEAGDQPLCLILGTDAFLGLPKWHRWEKLLELAHIIVMGRPGTSGSLPGELGAVMADQLTRDGRELCERPAGCVYCWDGTPLAISATQIRSLIASGRSARYLVPDEVWNIILTEEMYKSDAI